MARNKKRHGNKKPSAVSTTPRTSVITETSNSDASVTEHMAAVPQLDTSAARTVFNTVELLEMVLAHPPIKSLTRALLVSQKWRDVITNNYGLRQTLFLEGTQASEFLVRMGWKHETTTISGITYHSSHRPLAIAKSPLQDSRDSRVIVTTHPALYALPVSRYFLYAEEEHHLPSYRTEGVACGRIKNLPADTFLFQPPITKVVVFHRGSRVLLKCNKGVTFGMVAEQLEKQYARDLRKKKKKQTVNGIDVDKLPSIHEPLATSRRNSQAPHHESCHLLRELPCLRLEAESAVEERSLCVRHTREKLMNEKREAFYREQMQKLCSSDLSLSFLEPKNIENKALGEWFS